ncbi:MAG: c-type cytochrome, partial [Candidatus Acidiferrales bacterium]
MARNRIWLGTAAFISAFIAIVGVAILTQSLLDAQSTSFHGAPASDAAAKDPYAGKAPAAQAGANLFAQKCQPCHGVNGQGTANIPALAKGAAQSAPDGAIFWFITQGDSANGMPSWAALPEKQRWELVTYIKALGTGKAPKPIAANEDPAASAGSASVLPPATPPFTDYRYEKPGTVRKITVQDLPAPFATKSAGNAPKVVARPEGAWPKALPGFTVQLYASDLNNPRLITTAPNGDFFVAQMDAGDIKIFRGITAEGKPVQVGTFASGFDHPYGIAFYPPGNDPQWIYIGSETSVQRIPYRNGDLKARGAAEHIADLPGEPGHSTRAVQFSKDGKTLFVAVGSGSNVDDPDTHPEEKNRADILAFNPDGSDMRVYAYGIRNAGGGIEIDSESGELWCSVNERDGLGDNLVPDYITHVQEGGFYGWPWWYMGGHQD